MLFLLIKVAVLLLLVMCVCVCVFLFVKDVMTCVDIAVVLPLMEMKGKFIVGLVF